MKTRRQSAVEEDLNLPLNNQVEIKIIPKVVTNLNLPAEKHAAKVVQVEGEGSSLENEDNRIEVDEENEVVIDKVEDKGKGKEILVEEPKEVVDLIINKDLLVINQEEASIEVTKLSVEVVKEQTSIQSNIQSIVKESTKGKEILNLQEQVSSSSGNINNFIPIQQDSLLASTASTSNDIPMDFDIPVVIEEGKQSETDSSSITPIVSLPNSNPGEIELDLPLPLESNTTSGDIPEELKEPLASSSAVEQLNLQHLGNSSTTNSNETSHLGNNTVDPSLLVVRRDIEVEVEKVQDDIMVDEDEVEDDDDDDDDEEDEDEDDEEEEDNNQDPSEGGNAIAGPSHSTSSSSSANNVDNATYVPTPAAAIDSVKRPKRNIKGPSAILGKEKIKPIRIPRIMKEKPAGAPMRKGGVVGRLSWLSNKLPIELMIEILSHLSPDMLLRLTRTAKLFRSVLLSKGYRGLWINALEQCDGLIFKAKDWTEVQYTSLMWDKECALCNRAGVHKSDYSFRMRMCDKCAKTMTSSQDKIELVNPSIHPLTWELCLSSERRINSRTPGVLYYHTPTVVATNAYLTTLMVQDTDEPHTEPNNPDVEGEILSRVDLFKKERSELLPLIKEDMEAIHTWQDRLERERSVDREKLLLERKVAILRRCEAAGYDGNTVVAVIQSPTSQVIKYTHQPYPLTDRVWTKISTFIYNEIARYEEAKRLAAEEAIKRKAEADEAARLRLQALYRAGAGLPGGIDGLNNWMDGHYDNYDAGYDSDDYGQY